jgi:hypothetical protein
MLSVHTVRKPLVDSKVFLKKIVPWATLFSQIHIW